MMNKLTCQICKQACKSFGSLSNHIRIVHNIKSKIYYDTYFKKNNNHLCIICKTPTAWQNINLGYKPTCSHKCGGIYHRQNLKKDKEKYQKFYKKLQQNYHNRMNRWKEDGTWIEISGKISQTVKNKNKDLTQQELKDKYGWINKLTEKEKEKFINEILLNTGAHKWWKSASEKQKNKVYEARRQSNIKNNNLIDRRDLNLLESYEQYKKEVQYLTEKTYRKYKNKINPNNYKRGRGKKYFHLDHKFSISKAFIEKIPPVIVACQDNLQMLPALVNGSKNYKCSITKEQLYKFYEKQKT